MSGGMVQARFFTKEEKWNIGEIQISLNRIWTPNEFDKIISNLLKLGHTQFEYLCLGKSVKINIGDFAVSNNLNTEIPIPIEYIKLVSPPKLVKSILQDDWICRIRSYKNNILVSTFDGTVSLYKTESLGESRALSSIRLATFPIAGLCVDDYGRFMAGHYDGKISLCEFREDGITEIEKYGAHSKPIQSLDYFEDKFLSAGGDNLLKIWEIDGDHTCGYYRERSSFSIGKLRPTCAAWASNESVCTCSHDLTIKIWDVSKNAETESLNLSDCVLRVAFLKGNRTCLSGSTDCHVRLHDFRDRAVTQGVFRGHSNWVGAVEWVGDEMFVSGGYDGVVKLWDIRMPGNALYNMNGHEDKVFDVECTCEGLVISGGADSVINFYNL